MLGQQKIRIKEEKLSKFTALSDGCEMVSNDATMKIVLRHITVMDGTMENGFYSTKIWIKEGDGWIEGNGAQNYPTIEGFIRAMEESEDFTQAIDDYRFNSKNNNEL